MHQPRVVPAALAGALVLLALSSLPPRGAFAGEGPPPALPWVTQVAIGGPAPCDTCPRVACPGRPIPVHVSGVFEIDCWTVRRVELLPRITTDIGPPTLRIVIDDRACLDRVCLARPTPWKATAVLPALPAGDFRLRVEVAHVSCADSFPPDSVRAAHFAFRVQPECPPGDPLPYVDRVHFGTPPCVTCLPEVCPDQPFPVTLSGVVPGNCVEFRGLSLVPVVNIRPGPPIVRATFAVNDCLGMPCTDHPQRWTATVTLPGLPAGGNGLIVESMQVSMCDSSSVLALDAAGFPFVVLERCPPPKPCLVYDWSPRSSDLCNATFVNDTAGVDLRIASPVALAGLQGVLRTQPGLEVRGLHPIGPASGMTLQWTKRPDGAAFVMFATAGTPIAARAFTASDTVWDFAPVLRVEVKAVPYANIPENPPVRVFVLRADSLLGSDASGTGVPACVLRCNDAANARCAPPVARFCLSARCDVNHDGRADVRDLVLMVRCLVPGGGCPDSTARFDCDGDGTFSIDDVICCAWAILRGHGPGGGAGRPEPSVALGFGEPVRSGDALELPITLHGADRVGAARLALRFPADRYDVEGFGPAGNPPGWLVLHEVEGGEVVVGLVATDPSQAGVALPLSLRLRLRAGAGHGGEVVAQGAEVSGTDGAALETAIAGAGAVVDPAAAISFASVGPNPAAGQARFTLSLPRAADVDLAVHDLAGRRVATLHRGALAAGVHPFTWNGRTDRGEAARDGVYFVRMRAGGTEIARKTVFVRGR